MRKFYNDDLQHQYEHDGHFRNRVDHSEVAYSALLKKSSQASILDGLHDSMLEKFIGDDNHPTYFFYGYLQPPPNRSEKELLLYLVKNFQPEPGVPFTFIYFNHHTPSSDYYFRFRSLFELLPLRVVEKMRHFYLIKPYFYIKAFDMLGQSNKIFSETYQTLDNCQELIKREGYKVHDFVTFVPEEISEQFPTHLKRRPSLLTYRINVEGQNLSEQQLKEKRDFQNSVRALITKQVFKLQNYELGELGIPVVLQLLVGYFKEKPQALLQEGIFRKSVSVDEEEETLQELSSRNFSYLQQITNPHLIASLIKKFFSNLKEPVIPFALFDRLMHDQGVANKRDFVKHLLSTLPTLNFLSLMFVIDFLRKDVVPLEKQTKMSAHNLAICFSPALMRSEKPSFADIVNASKAVIITEIMINDFDEVFGQEQQRKKMFEKSMIDRRINLKRDLKEELGINIDDRTSEEVPSNSFILDPQSQPQHQTVQSSQKHAPTPPKVEQRNINHQTQQTQPPQAQPPQAQPLQSQPQPQWGTLITKQSAPVTLSKEVYKSDIHAEQGNKQQTTSFKSQEIDINQAEIPRALHQVKSQSYQIQPIEGEYEPPKSKMSKHNLVQLILKNENKQDPTTGTHSPLPPPVPEEKPSVTRSSIAFVFAPDQN